MEGSAASDGGRILKLGVIALGSLVWAAPLRAQSTSDPLAPLPPNTPQQQSAPQQPSTPAVDQAPTVVPPAQPPIVTGQAKPVIVPKDWRGVFDAIDSGNWA